MTYAAAEIVYVVMQVMIRSKGHEPYYDCVQQTKFKFIMGPLITAIARKTINTLTLSIACHAPIKKL